MLAIRHLQVDGWGSSGMGWDMSHSICVSGVVIHALFCDELEHSSTSIYFYQYVCISFTYSSVAKKQRMQ